jgi:hypothetical protein
LELEPTPLDRVQKELPYVFARFYEKIEVRDVPASPGLATPNRRLPEAIQGVTGRAVSHELLQAIRMNGAASAGKVLLVVLFVVVFVAVFEVSAHGGSPSEASSVMVARPVFPADHPFADSYTIGTPIVTDCCCERVYEALLQCRRVLISNHCGDYFC